MILPQRASVRPRVRSHNDAGTTLLEELVAAMLERGESRTVAVCGGVGAGKSAALRHLAAALPADARLRLIDNAPADARPPGVGGQRVVVCAVAGWRCEWAQPGDA